MFRKKKSYIQPGLRWCYHIEQSPYSKLWYASAWIDGKRDWGYGSHHRKLKAMEAAEKEHLRKLGLYD